jgi:hypothetical protein
MTFTATPVQSGWGQNFAPGPPAFTGSFDKNYIQSFTVSSSVTVAHNLQKYPAVTVVSSAKQVIICDIDYIDMNTLTVNFTAPFSGTVYCN